MQKFTYLLLLAITGLSLPVMAEKPIAKPNILLIVAEDLSPRIGAYGDNVAQTPNLDKLAEQSVRFTNVYAAAGVCAPNRSALISGMFPISLGTHQMRTSSLPLPTGQQGYEAVPPDPMKAFPELLRRAGYATANFAKKDYQFGEPSTIWDIDTGNYLSPLVSDLWAQLPKDKPFFAMVNLMSTHEGHLIAPDAVPTGKFAGLFSAIQKKQREDVRPVTSAEDVIVPPYYPDTPQVRQSLAQHYDNIHYMDSEVGRILQALEDDGLADNTIVIWTTDHGDALPRAKRSVYDTGLLIPLLIRFPDKQKAGTTDSQLISMVDFAPTILTFANAPVPEFIQGRNIFSPGSRQYIYGSRDRMDLVPDRVRAVRDLHFKYIRNEMADIAYFRPLLFRDSFPIMQSWWQQHNAGSLNKVQNFYFTAPRPAEELYDTQNDPWEINNIADDPKFRQKLIELRKELDAWTTRVNDRSNVDELVMVEAMWPEFIQPITTKPEFAIVSCGSGQCLTISSKTNNASISYQLGEASDWQIYTSPVKLVHGSTIQAKSIRYGYQDSPVEQYHYE
jgi:N-sulfoglucosamine sulfohydrolase